MAPVSSRTGWTRSAGMSLASERISSPLRSGDDSVLAGPTFGREAAAAGRQGALVAALRTAALCFLQAVSPEEAAQRYAVSIGGNASIAVARQAGWRKLSAPQVRVAFSSGPSVCRGCFNLPDSTAY